MHGVSFREDEKMIFNWFQGKNRKLFTGIIIAILVLALVIPICANFLL